MNQGNFEKQKNNSLAHQLVKIGRLINARGLIAVREAYQLPELKQSHLDIFPFIDFEGTSISEIALRKGVSKQSVSKIVKEMTLMKLLFFKDAPNDGRSKLVFFNTSGPLSIDIGLAALTAIDQQLVNEIGKNNYQRLLQKTSNLIRTLQLEKK